MQMLDASPTVACGHKMSAIRCDKWIGIEIYQTLGKQTFCHDYVAWFRISNLKYARFLRVSIQIFFSLSMVGIPAFWDVVWQRFVHSCQGFDASASKASASGLSGQSSYSHGLWCDGIQQVNFYIGRCWAQRHWILSREGLFLLEGVEGVGCCCLESGPEAGHGMVEACLFHLQCFLSDPQTVGGPGGSLSVVGSCLGCSLFSPVYTFSRTTNWKPTN